MNLPFSIDTILKENKEESSVQESKQASPSTSLPLVQETESNATDLDQSQFEQILESSPGPVRRRRKISVIFNEWQVSELEKRFKMRPYISIAEHVKIASALGLTEKQVKIWFQNRLKTQRKEFHSETTSNMSTPSEVGNNPSAAPNFDRNTTGSEDSGQ
ncbi:hypothetical protein Aperf_G00000004756 [Anoplocephala perfoliata]